MSIYRNSRYRRVDQLQVEDSDGVTAQVYATRETTLEAPTTYTTRIVQEGDTFESLATELLGTPELWWVLADLNVEAAFCPLDLAAGTEIIVPTRTWAGLQR